MNIQRITNKYAMKIIPKLKLKSLRKELDVLHEKLTLFRILDRDRGKLPGTDEKVQEISDESEVNINQELNMDIIEPMRVSRKNYLQSEKLKFLF